MIYILSWTIKKLQKTLSRLIHSKLKKIQGLFKDLHRNLRTFQGKMEFKDFSRTSPKSQGLFKTVRALKQLRVITGIVCLRNVLCPLSIFPIGYVID